MSGTSTSADLWAHSRDEETKESSIKRKNYEPFRLANMYKAGKQITLRAKARVSYGAAELADKLDRARRRA